MERTARWGGLAALVVAVAYACFWALEVYRGHLGFADADNPATMISFLRQHPDMYTLSGLPFVVMSAALVVVVLSVREIAAVQGDTVLLRTATVFGLIAAAYLFGQGILRVQSPGTLLHMSGLDPDWGLAAFLAVQMAGTQGLGSSGGFALSLWAVGASMAGLRGRRRPRLLVLLAVAPATQVLVGLFGPLLDERPWLDPLYLVYLGSILGVLLWCLALGIALLRWQAPRELATHPVEPEASGVRDPRSGLS